MTMWFTGNANPHLERGCASQGVDILTGNGDEPHREWDAPHRECTSSLGMEMFLTGIAHLNRESISSPGMHIVYTE